MKLEAGSFSVPRRRFLSLSHTYKPHPSIHGTPGVSRRMTRSENSPRLVLSTALPSDRPVIQFLQTGTHSPMCLSGGVRVARAGHSVSRFPLGNQPEHTVVQNALIPVASDMVRSGPLIHGFSRHLPNSASARTARRSFGFAERVVAEQTHPCFHCQPHSSLLLLLLLL